MANFHDGFLDRQTEYGKLSSTVQLVADNQAVVLDPGQGMLILNSDNTTATNRTFTLSSGDTIGQQLRVIMTSGSSFSCDLANTGNVKLSAAWQPLAYDSITLLWDGTYWVELCRCDAA